MYPVNTAMPDCTTFVPSLVAPTRMVMVQHLFQPRRELSQRDIYVLQRTALPDGQPWIFTLTDEQNTTEMVQISLVSETSITPREALASPALLMPPMLLQPIQSGNVLPPSMVPPPPMSPDITGEIYGN